MQHKVEDFENIAEKNEKDPAKAVDTEIEDFVRKNPRLFDKAFVSTNEEVQVGFCFAILSLKSNLMIQQHKALKIFYETTAISQEKKLEVVRYALRQRFAIYGL